MSGIYGFLICVWLSGSFVFTSSAKHDASILEDAHLTTIDLLRKYGYEAEDHKIETKDGFQLGVYRIPKPGAQPVLLVHGLEACSLSWVSTGPNNALAYLLSDRGYDVWMLNTRGNRYSRKHRKYRPHKREFWDFSFHEVGIYDLPATIDYILNRCTHHRKLHYVGHSQGTSAFFVMASERPKYVRKIKLLQALGPVAYFHNLESPLPQFFKPHLQGLLNMAKFFHIYEFPPEPGVWNGINYNLCSFVFPNPCAYVLMFLMGMDSSQFNETLIPIIAKNYMAGTSMKSIEHYGQLLRKGGFHKFNYDPLTNFFKYGSIFAPEYELSHVNCKVALFYSENDMMSSVKDVKRLRKKLPNVVHDELLTFKKFCHADFVIGIHVKEMLYDSMFTVMEKVDKGEL